MILLLVIAGCGGVQEPRNFDDLNSGGGYQPALSDFEREKTERDEHLLTTTLNARLPLAKCTPNTQYDNLLVLAPNRDEAPISKGDLLRITVSGDAMLSGDFEIEAEGLLRLPQMPAFIAHGVAAPVLEKRIRQGLVEEQLYRGDGPPVSIKILERAAVLVHVSGAVFEPGVAALNIKGETKDQIRQQASGEAPGARTLTAALQRAAGVRPDADIQRIIIRRAGRDYRVDLKPAALGEDFFDPFMMADDEVIVPSMGCFQPGLAKPSPVTRVGIKVNMSNLTEPVFNNSAAGIQKETQEMRYGSTMLQALFRMNCIGGVASVSAARHAVLATKNPITGEFTVIRRAIEDLIRRADRSQHNPILMPGDSIACYDSTVVNFREAIGLLGDLIAPVGTVIGLF